MKLIKLGIIISLSLLIGVLAIIAALATFNVVNLNKTTVIETKTSASYLNVTTTKIMEKTIEITNSISPSTIAPTKNISTTISPISIPIESLKKITQWTDPSQATFKWSDCNNETNISGMMIETPELNALESLQVNISEELVKDGWSANNCNTKNVGKNYNIAYTKSGGKIILTVSTDTNTAEINVNKVKYTLFYGD
ncbi:MAG: hypothetical protein WCJ19_01020 [bacterium]